MHLVTSEDTPLASEVPAAEHGGATRLDDHETAEGSDDGSADFAPAPLREGEARDDSALLRPDERLLLVLRRCEDGTFLLLRRADPDGGPASGPAMLATPYPHPDEGLEAGLAAIVRTHLGLPVEGAPRLAEAKRPVRMGHPYTGGPTMGLLRAVALDVTGTPEAGALFEGCDALSATEAEAALATDLERAIFRDGVALFG